MVYTRLSADKLYCLCNRHQWFTNGDPLQYRRLFERNKQGAPLETLAAIIRICSAETNEQKILEILRKECDLYD